VPGRGEARHQLGAHDRGTTHTRDELTDEQDIHAGAPPPQSLDLQESIPTMVTLPQSRSGADGRFGPWADELENASIEAIRDEAFEGRAPIVD